MGDSSDSVLIEILRSSSRPMESIPTKESPVLHHLPGIRAVLFDVYGTMLISGSGDVGTTKQAACTEALGGALESLGVEPTRMTERRELANRGMESFFEIVEASHAASRANGARWPEIDITTIWQQVVDDLLAKSLIDEHSRHRIAPRVLAVQYEVRANPCWPMPNLLKCLAGLREEGVAIGIISNAQFYTPLLLESLLGAPLEKLGFSEDLQYYSYRYGVAKPGDELYLMAAETLRNRGIEATETLYVGNDVLNDVAPARKLGFHTGLFAGDARSLRRRVGDSAVEGVAPDLVVTDLAQLLRCAVA